MPTDVIMPQMGESIFEGSLTKWLKQTSTTHKRPKHGQGRLRLELNLELRRKPSPRSEPAWTWPRKPRRAKAARRLPMGRRSRLHSLGRLCHKGKVQHPM